MVEKRRRQHDPLMHLNRQEHWGNELASVESIIFHFGKHT
jgi:hypothetical protein